MDEVLLSSNDQISEVRFLEIWKPILSRLRAHNVYLVLWTHGERDYAGNCLYVTNLKFYFDLVLTRSDCDDSMDETGVLKSAARLRSAYLLPLAAKYTLYTILVDDHPENGGVGDYDLIIDYKAHRSPVLVYQTIRKAQNKHVGNLAVPHGCRGDSGDAASDARKLCN